MSGNFCSYGDKQCPSRVQSLLCLLALGHSTLTFHLYSPWTADAAWFLGTGLGLLLLAVLNLTHIGIEPWPGGAFRPGAGGMWTLPGSRGGG